MTYIRLPDLQLFNLVAENHFITGVNAEYKAEYFQLQSSVKLRSVYNAVEVIGTIHYMSNK